MFRRHIFATSLVLIIIATTSVMTLLKYSEADRQALQQLVGEDQATDHQMSQRRTLVRRDIIDFSPQAKHTVFLSDEAELVFDLDQNKAVEKLTRPRAFIQEELIVTADGQPQQFLRHMEAHSGVYHHQEQKIECQQVVFARFIIQGHEPIDDVSLLEPLIDGAATSITANLSENAVVEASDFSMSSPTGLRVNGQRAFYNGKSAVLKGAAELGGQEGQVVAKEITLTFPADNKAYVIHHAALKDDVAITLASGAQLRCDDGQVDLESGKAVFASLPTKSVMCQQAPTKEGLAGTKIQSNRFTAYFDMTIPLTDAKMMKIDEIVAEGEVVVTEAGQWTAMGDVGTFKSTAQEAHSNEGVITLISLNNDKKCIFNTATGTHLCALQMSSDTSQGTVCLQDVSGLLPGVEETTFQAKEACWNNLEGLLLLRDGLVIEHALGRLENNTQVSIQLHQSSSERELSRIEAFGDTTVAMRASGAANPQTLSCHGDVLVDHTKHMAHFGSPNNRVGTVPRDEQVFFCDGSGELHSDVLDIDYVSNEGQIVPSHIAAQGNTCIKGRLGHPLTEGAAQYALCDVLEYWPDQQRILLSAREGRVALLDRPNGVAVSAPAVEVRRDLVTKKDVVKGLGDVRFSLLDREYQRIKERFNFDLSEIP